MGRAVTEPADDLIDFDAWLAERERATLPIKVGGVVYQVPATPPAIAVLESVRRQRSGRTTVPREEVVQLAEGILGTDTCHAIMRAASLSLPELMQLVQMVTEKQTAAVTPPPNRAARRTRPPRNRSTSSPRGRSSRRTSSGNTASTSGRTSKA